nr:zinc ribbon domain-containing protein [Anaeromassilibacillus sp. D41t1_190614_C2]
MQQRRECNIRAGSNQSILRYSGLLRCQDCGRSFVGKRVRLKSGERVEYRCDTYHRYGKEYCTSHTVEEAALDELICKELLATKRMYQANWDAMDKLIERWRPKAASAVAQIKKLKERIDVLEEELEVILMERIRDKSNAERYERMIHKREKEIASAKKQIEDLQNMEAALRDRQTRLKRDISLIDDILKEGRMSEAHLRMLVDKIYVREENGKLSLEICLKAPFRDHVDIYENGQQVDSLVSLNYDFDRLANILMEDEIEDEMEA